MIAMIAATGIQYSGKARDVAINNKHVYQISTDISAGQEQC